jgi:hypothetical protein
LRTPCARCGYYTIMGEFCLYCQIEMAGLRVTETLGPPIDGYTGVAHAHKKYSAGRNLRRGGYHMSVTDWRALGKFHSDPK